MNKRKLFENVVFEIFKNEDAFDKCNHQLMRAYDIYCNDVDDFSKMETDVQFQIVNTACKMAMGSSLRSLRIIEVLRTKKPVHDIERDYCPEFGFKETERLLLTEQRILPVGRIK